MSSSIIIVKSMLLNSALVGSVVALANAPHQGAQLTRESQFQQHSNELGFLQAEPDLKLTFSTKTQCNQYVQTNIEGKEGLRANELRSARPNIGGPMKEVLTHNTNSTNPSFSIMRCCLAVLLGFIILVHAVRSQQQEHAVEEPNCTSNIACHNASFCREDVHKNVR